MVSTMLMMTNNVHTKYYVQQSLLQGSEDFSNLSKPNKLNDLYSPHTHMRVMLIIKQ